MMGISKEAFVKHVEVNDPTLFSELGDRYEVIPCACSYEHCQGWATRTTREYEDSRKQQIDDEISQIQRNKQNV